MIWGRPVVLASCATNAFNALVLRHLAEPPNCTQTFPNLLCAVIGPILTQRYRIALQANLEEQWQVGRGQVKLRAILKSSIFDRVKCDRAKTFVKREVCTTMPSKARLIQGNVNEITAYEHPEEYVALSQALKEPLEFDLEGVAFMLQYAGGMNHEALSESFTLHWSLAGPNRVLDERDGKNWDSTMQRPLLSAAIELYDLLGLAAAASAWRRAEGVKGAITFRRGYPCVIKYWTAWKRLSGDWDTSVGNTLISMLVAMVTILRLPKNLRPTRVSAYFMGDDYLAIYSHQQPVCQTSLKQALDYGDSAMGITPVRAIFADPMRVSFISLGLWPCRDGTWQFVPHPGKQLVKLFAAVPSHLPKDIRAYQTALAEAFWPVYWGWPLMMKFLKMHYTSKTPQHLNKYTLKVLSKNVRPVMWAEGFIIKYRLPFVATHFDFERCSFAQHPVVDAMLAFETADPHQRV